MSYIVRIGDWEFEAKRWQARRIGKDSKRGAKYNAVSDVIQVNKIANFELTLSQTEFTRCDYRTFSEFCETMGLEPEFKRSRDIA